MAHIRHYPDGSIGFSRPDPDHEAHLDRTYIRVPGERRWWPRPRTEAVEIETLRAAYHGRRAVVLGKGPSVERIREVEIGDADIVAAINEAARLATPPRITVGLGVDQHVIDAVAGRLRAGTTFLAPASIARGDGVSAIGPGLWDESLRPNMGASPAMLRLLRLCGVSSLVLLGMDGYDAPTPGKVYAPSVLALGVTDRDSGDFGAVNGALADEIAHWPAESVTWWHRLPKPRKPKGGA